jgi:uncharacterized protein YchJ
MGRKSAAQLELEALEAKAEAAQAAAALAAAKLAAVGKKGGKVVVQSSKSAKAAKEKKAVKSAKKAVTKEKKVRKPRAKKAEAERKPGELNDEEWVAIAVQSVGTRDKKNGKVKQIGKWLEENHPTALQQNSRFVRLQVPRILMRLLGNGYVLQYKSKWRISKKGLKKFGDVNAEA